MVPEQEDKTIAASFPQEYVHQNGEEMRLILLGQVLWHPRTEFV